MRCGALQISHPAVISGNKRRLGEDQRESRITTLTGLGECHDWRRITHRCRFPDIFLKSSSEASRIKQAGSLSTSRHSVRPVNALQCDTATPVFPLRCRWNHRDGWTECTFRDQLHSGFPSEAKFIHLTSYLPSRCTVPLCSTRWQWRAADAQ